MEKNTLASAMIAELTRRLLATPRGQMVSMDQLAAASPVIELTDGGLYTLLGHEGALTRSELLELQEDVLDAVMDENLFVNCRYEWENSGFEDSDAEWYGPGFFSVHDMVEPGEEIGFEEINRLAIAIDGQLSFDVDVISFHDDLLCVGRVSGDLCLERICVRVDQEQKSAIKNLIAETRIFEWGRRYACPEGWMVLDGSHFGFVILLNDGRVFASSGENGEPSTFCAFWCGLQELAGVECDRVASGLESRMVDKCGGMLDLLQQAMVLEEGAVE